MQTSLIGWDKDGNVVRQRHELLVPDEDGRYWPADFEAHELAGGHMTDIIVLSAVAVRTLAEADQIGKPFVPGDTRRLFAMDTRKTYLMDDNGQWVETERRVEGAGSWPEFLGSIDGFRVERRPGVKGGSHRIRALVHKASGHRRERAAIQAEIERRVRESIGRAKVRGAEMRAELRAQGLDDALLDPPPETVDVGDLLGGPADPLLIDDQGRTVAPTRRSAPALPVVAARERG